jgi:5-methylcytosine-specific restriction endonuclease McrA
MGVRRFHPRARVALFLAARGRCVVCGEPLPPGWHADHVVPVSKGGPTDPANGRALCERCNLVKGPRPA